MGDSMTVLVALVALCGVNLVLIWQVATLRGRRGAREVQGRGRGPLREVAPVQGCINVSMDGDGTR